MIGRPIRLIAGLGNPGSEYEKTPHNAGFWLVDEIARHFNGHLRVHSKFHSEICKVCVAGHECWLLKPMTFINRSGGAVNTLVRYYRVDQTEVVVAHDELDFIPGVARIKFGGGHGGHNGLRDIMPVLGRNFYRLRIGVGHPGAQDKVTSYLLGCASKEVYDGVMRSIADIMDVIGLLVAGDIDRATLQLHSKRSR